MRMDCGKSQFHPQNPPYMRMDGRKLMGLYWEEGPSDTKDIKDTNERGILQDAWEGTKKRESDKFVECSKSRNLSNSREVLSLQLSTRQVINKAG